jgi:hypothetical protein
LRYWGLVVVVMLMWCAGAEGAPDVTLAWDPSPETDIAGYKLHYGLGSGQYDQFIDVRNATTAVVSGLAVGQTFYFVVTAYNTAGIESLPSNEVSFTQPVPQPASMNVQVLDPADPDFPKDIVNPLGENGTHPAVVIGQVRWSAESGCEFTVRSWTGTTVSLYRSDDLVTWVPLGTMPNPTGGLRVNVIESAEVRHRYFRAVVE